MPTFVYEAADVRGRVTSGRVDGASEVEAARTLEQKQLTPLRMRRAKAAAESYAAAGGKTRLRLRLRELLEFSRQLKVMLGSGVTLLTTLSLLRHRASGAYRQILDCIAGDIQRGATLSEALAAHPRTFDPFYVGTIRAGEAAGVHTEALKELIAYYERRADLRREVVGALTYPAIVIGVLVMACVVLLTFVVPQFQSIFATVKAELPLPTRVLLGTSAFITGYWRWLLGGAALASVGAWRLAPVPAVRSAVGRAVAKLPLVGQVFYLGGVIQFCRMTSLLERSGLPLLETLKVVGDMLMPGAIRDLVIRVRREVATGSSITDALQGARVLPDLVEQMIHVGEQTGCIDETLAAAAAHYDEEMRVRIKRMTVLLEPALTMGISLIVLGVAMAIFLPMWQMNSALLHH